MRVSFQLALLAGVASLGPIAARAEEEASASPVLTETLTSGVYALEGGFDVKAGTHVVWQVLTDYEGLPRFVHSVHSSVAQSVGDGGVQVEQHFEGKLLIFTRDLSVLLDVSEHPERGITFRDRAHRDFDDYRGAWQIRELPTGSRVIYLLRAKPHDAIPEFLARGAFKDGAIQMLIELRDEILRRNLSASLSRLDLARQEGGGQ